MARKRPQAHSLNRLRDAYRIASSPVSSALADLDDELAVNSPTRRIPRFISPAVPSGLLEIEDRRRWEPNRLTRPVRSARRWNVATTLAPLARDRSPLRSRAFFKLSPTRKDVARNVSLGGMRFKAPRHVIVCVRRKQRKEVLHALGKVGKGSSRKRRRNALSDVRC